MAKIIGNTIGVPNPQSDWYQTDKTKADYVKGSEEYRNEVNDKISSNTPVGNVKENLTKTVLLSSLKGGLPLKQLYIGQSTASNISSTARLNISLHSMSLIDCMEFEKWEQTSISSTKRNAFFDITNLVQPDKDGNYPILGMGYELIDSESIPTYFGIYAEQINENSEYPTYSNLGNTIVGKSYFISDKIHLKKVVLDFSKVAEHISAGKRIMLGCASGTFVTSNAALFNLWLSRFKYLQLERLNTTEDEISDFYLGKHSASKSVTITLSSIGYGGTFINSNELKNFYLENSGYAQLVLNSPDSCVAPSDICVEYYEDADLKYQKLERDLTKLIETNTAAIIANGGSE